MFVCQFFGYAVTYNDSFSSPHSDFCAFFCPCLEKLSELENDRTISPAVHQTQTHFPTAAASSAISQRWNHRAKLFCQNNCCSARSLRPHSIRISHRSDRTSCQALWHLQQIASLFLACHGFLVCACTCLNDCCMAMSLLDFIQQI